MEGGERMEKLESIPLNEQETVINISRDNIIVDIWTNDRTMITKLNKLVKDSNNYKIEKLN